MPKYFNSASRILTLLNQVLSLPNEMVVAEAWAKTFDIVETNTNKKYSLVSERLGWMRREVEILSTQMTNTNISPELYNDPLTRIEHALSIMILGGRTEQVKQYLGRETIVALSFCADILSDEESEISTNNLTEIREKVEELRASLNESSISLRLRQLLQHHIDLIEHALAEYPISGAKALREAARTGLGEIIEIKDEVKQGSDSLPIGKLAAVWKKFNEVADNALKAEKIARLGQKAWEVIENFLP